MRLGLSSAAAPAASLDALLDAARLRGLAAVELVEGHGHGLDPRRGKGPAPAEAARAARDAGIEIAGFRLATPGGEDPVDSPGAADLVPFARDLGAPLLVPLGAPETGFEPDTLERAGAAVTIVLPPGGEALVALDRVGPDRALAWEADPGADDLAGIGAALFERAGHRLRHIVLRGGGPESTEQEGRGVGSLMTRLAVAGFRGTVALAPSSPRYRTIWDAWLGRRGGWGCGSTSEDRSLVSLGGAT